MRQLAKQAPDMAVLDTINNPIFFSYNEVIKLKCLIKCN